jgi:hypothetical protein
VTEREKLERQIYVLEMIITANTLVLKSKPMRDEDRQALQRQIFNPLEPSEVAAESPDATFEVAQDLRGRRCSSIAFGVQEQSGGASQHQSCQPPA